MKWMGVVGTNTKNAEFKVPGLSGINLQLVMLAGYQDLSSLKNVSNLPGEYRVAFTLSRPGFSPVPHGMFSPSEHLEGDSHLAIAPPALKYSDGRDYDYDALVFSIRTEAGEFEFKGTANQKGMLSKIETEPFRAEHFGDAATKALHAIAPGLSSLSLFLDVPVNIYQIDVAELSTNTHRISIKAPFKDVIAWMPPLENASIEQQKYASLYREALNSTSSNYTFLCLYRMIEGLRDRREKARASVVAEALQKSEKPPPQPDEQIPNEQEEQKEWLNSLYTSQQEWDDFALQAIFISEVVGRRIRNLIDKGQELHKLRNKIAHAVLDSGEPMISIDSGVDVEEVERWLPITKFIARYLFVDSFPDILQT
jgi:hypothetical protein